MARYQGFAASSAIVASRVVEIHAGDAAFLWGIRSKAVASQKYRLRDLARADERVEAHLDGISVAGDEGWGMLVDDLELGLPGALFAGSVWAMRAGQEGRLRAVLDSAQEARARLDAVVSGFGWAWSGGTGNERPELPGALVGLHAAAQTVSNQPPDSLARRLLADGNGPSRYVGIGAFAACRLAPPYAEVDAMLTKETWAPALARAARMVGEVGITGAAATLEPLLGHHEREVRQAAAWSMAMLQPQRKSYLPILMTAAQDEAPDVDALEMAGRKLPAEQVLTWTRALAKEGRVRAALIASAACGAPVLIDDILTHLAQPETARLAGFVFSQITGADLVKLGLELHSKPAEARGDLELAGKQDGADLEEEAPSRDQAEEADRDLPVPDPDRVTRWWREHKGELSLTQRYLAGRPVTEPGLRQTLAEGTQPQRRAAAVELAGLLRRGPVYNTSQPGFIQARDLLGWT